MIVGTELPQAMYLKTDAGVAVVYASKAAFTAAGWAITWYDQDGVALASQPTWDLQAGTSDGRHVVSFINPSGQWTAKVTQLAGHFSNPIEFGGEGLANDADTLYAAWASSGGSPATDTSTDGEVTMYHGDSIRIDLTVLEAALTAIGATSLADCSAIAAEIKRTSQDSDDAADVTTLAETIVTDTSGNRLVRASLDAFPVILAVADDEDSLTARCDLRLTKGTKTIIAATRTVRVLWKATTA